MNNCIIGSEPLNGRTGHEAGRSLLKRLYAQHIGGEMPEILIAEGGKPYFSTGAVHFSISHTKRHVFCVLSDREVGIDAEELDRIVSPQLAAKLLSPEELAQYDAATDQNRAMLTFWVLKEAAVKSTGEGLRGIMKPTSFRLNDPRVTEISNCLVALISKEDTHAF